MPLLLILVLALLGVGAVGLFIARIVIGGVLLLVVMVALGAVTAMRGSR